MWCVFSVSVQTGTPMSRKKSNVEKMSNSSVLPSASTPIRERGEPHFKKEVNVEMNNSTMPPSTPTDSNDESFGQSQATSASLRLRCNIRELVAYAAFNLCLLLLLVLGLSSLYDNPTEQAVYVVASVGIIHLFVFHALIDKLRHRSGYVLLGVVLIFSAIVIAAALPESERTAPPRPNWDGCYMYNSTLCRAAFLHESGKFTIKGMDEALGEVFKFADTFSLSQLCADGFKEFLCSILLRRCDSQCRALPVCSSICDTLFSADCYSDITSFILKVGDPTSFERKFFELLPITADMNTALLQGITILSTNNCSTLSSSTNCTTHLRPYIDPSRGRCDATTSFGVWEEYQSALSEFHADTSQGVTVQTWWSGNIAIVAAVAAIFLPAVCEIVFFKVRKRFNRRRISILKLKKLYSWRTVYKPKFMLCLLVLCTISFVLLFLANFGEAQVLAVRGLLHILSFLVLWFVLKGKVRTFVLCNKFV